MRLLRSGPFFRHRRYRKTAHSHYPENHHARPLQARAAALGRRRPGSHHFSARTIEFHYHKHHQTYVDTLNKLVEGSNSPT